MIQKFRIVFQDTKLTSEVPREDLLDALDHYKEAGRKFVVVEA